MGPVEVALIEEERLRMIALRYSSLLFCVYEKLKNSKSNSQGCCITIFEGFDKKNLRTNKFLACSRKEGACL